MKKLAVVSLIFLGLASCVTAVVPEKSVIQNTAVLQNIEETTEFSSEEYFRFSEVEEVDFSASPYKTDFTRSDYFDNSFNDYSSSDYYYLDNSPFNFDNSYGQTYPDINLPDMSDLYVPDYNFDYDVPNIDIPDYNF